MGALQKTEQTAAIVQINDNAALMAAIARAASDPGVDVEKMERLLSVYERMESKRAEAEFARDLADMQAELPSIGERGNAAGRYTYALWEDINTAIKPVLSLHGFALSFRTDFTDGIAVTAVLQHRGGHREETTIKLPADKSGNKNDVQAVASAVSYGKRYTAGALLNLTSHGEDDDAYRAAVELVTDEQAATLRDMLEATGSNLVKYLEYMRAPSIERIPAKDYQRALAALKAKESKK